LDATPDKHEDLKATVEVISTLNKLIDLCDSWTASVGTGIELRRFTTQLQWRGDEDHVRNKGSYCRFLIAFIDLGT
jgi:hypothetical protein